MTEKEWLERYLAPLKGCTVTDVEVVEEGGQLWPKIKVSEPGETDGFELEISQDQEGNGPGFVFGLPRA